MSFLALISYFLIFLFFLNFYASIDFPSVFENEGKRREGKGGKYKEGGKGVSLNVHEY